ncbi:hypothetical protein Celaphus_00008742 [Cervus elaphus hippelaphus]|uniref:Uncharacterized protein n=1 Tax=Cervus elaphus hippelaphus TaxID=46360 RepID=A0A212CNR9_CEREH|nr:hypothetical protein Celaphus_00008742 [Cervus elaphus hippelaphus]
MCVTYRNDKKGINSSQAFVSSQLLCIPSGGVLAPQELVQLLALQRRFAESRTRLQELGAATQNRVEHLRWGSWVGRAQLVTLSDIKPLEQGTEVHGEEGPVPGMLVPRPVLLLNVLEETQDPLIGPVAGKMIVRMDFINSAINWLREKRMPALVSKEKEVEIPAEGI